MDTKRAKDNRKFQKLSESVTYRDAACGFLREKWSPLRNAPKLLARLAGATPRAAINWLTGESAPNGETLITLMARDPEFKSIILQLVEQRICGTGPISSNLDCAASVEPGD